MRHWAFRLALVGVLVLVTAGCDWSMYRYGPARTGFNPRESTIGAANVHSLVTKWAATIGGTVSAPSVANGRVYVSGNGNVYALNASTGAAVWTATIGGTVSAPSVANGKVYVSVECCNGHVYALNASTGAVVWVWTSESHLSDLVVADGTVYVAPLDYFEHAALDAETGELLYSAANAHTYFGTPAVHGGAVYAGGNVGDLGGDGQFWAFHLNGENFWQSPGTGESLYQAPSVANGDVYVAGASHLFVFNAGGCGSGDPDCSPLWTASLSGPSELAVTNAVAFTTAGGNLYAFDARGEFGCSGTQPSRTCQPIWTASGATGAPAVANGLVYAASSTGALVAFDANGTTNCSHATCQPLWTSPINAGGGAPVIANGTVYASGTNGKVYAFGLP